MKIRNVNPKICKEEILGVSYSGGGNRGAIHLGIMKALIEKRIIPTHIAGVSAGAFVGAFHAADPTSKSYSNLLRDFLNEMGTDLPPYDFNSEKIDQVIEGSYARTKQILSKHEN